MRFPSLAYLGTEARNAFTRFPLVLGSGLVAAAGGVAAVEVDGHQELFTRFLLAGSLGLPLFSALTLASAKRGLGRGMQLVLHGLGAALLVAFFFLWPDWREPVAIRRYIQLSLGFHFLVAAFPYVLGNPGTEDLNGFWQYNRTLFLRFLTSVLYTAVLFAGISVAILALDKLFGLDVAEEIYMDLWVLCAFVFNTWIFLGGVPRDFGALQESRDYPRGLRVFSQFILVPLVTLYLVILTLYMGKIAVTQVWPSGWIGWLVSSVAVVGILSLLLVFPVAGREENRWMRTYSRWFYVALLPSVAMLLMALLKRIGQYGITENRYFMVVLAVWLALIAVYFIVSRGKNIKIIPATLALLAFITFLGPWGAYAVSARSQTGRLEALLTEKGALVDGHIRKGADFSFEDRREISAVFKYLVETHGTDSIASWFEDDLAWADTLGVSRGYHHSQKSDEIARLAMAEMGAVYVHRWESQDVRTFNLWNPGAEGPLRIEGYEYVFAVGGVPSAAMVLDGRTYRVERDRPQGVVLKEDGDPLITIFLGDLIARAYRQADAGGVPKTVAVDSLTVRAENHRAAVMFFVRNLSGQEVDGAPSITGLNGDLYLRRKEP